MYPSKVKRIVADAPFHTVEGIPYGKKKINFNQPLSFIAQDVAIFFGGNLYGYEFDEKENSMLVILTNSKKIRIDFKEQRYDTQEEAQQHRGLQADCEEEHISAFGSDAGPER